MNYSCENCNSSFYSKINILKCPICKKNIKNTSEVEINFNDYKILKSNLENKDIFYIPN